MLLRTQLAAIWLSVDLETSWACVSLGVCLVISKHCMQLWSIWKIQMLLMQFLLLTSSFGVLVLYTAVQKLGVIKIKI